MANPWIMLAAVLAIVGAFVAGDIHGHRSEAATWRAKVEQARADAAEQARITEREQQEAVTNAIQHQYWEQVAIADGLTADLERLRNRPSRPAGVPEAARADCQGASGRELSAEDAGFLVRLAADADRHRAALAACYAYADAVIAPWKSRTTN